MGFINLGTTAKHHRINNGWYVAHLASEAASIRNILEFADGWFPPDAYFVSACLLYNPSHQRADFEL
jgi:hypothetical protein